MKPPADVRWYLLGLFAAITLLLDAWLHGPSLYQLLGGLGLQLGVAWIAWRVRPRPGFVLAAVVSFGLWTLLQSPPDALIAATYLVAALMLWAPVQRRWNPPIVAALAGLTILLVRPAEPLGYALAAVLAGLAALARPTQPTQDTLRGLRALALYLPAAAVAAVLAWNSATDFGQQYEGLDALLFGTALTAVLVLLSLGALGLTTLLETSEPFQIQAWNSSAAVLGVLAGYAAVVRDPSQVLQSLYLAAPTMAILGAVVVERLRYSLRRMRTPAGAIQVGMVSSRNDKVEEPPTDRSPRRWP